MRQHKVLLLNKKYNTKYQSSHTFLNCITGLYMNMLTFNSIFIYFHKKEISFLHDGVLFQKTY